MSDKLAAPGFRVIMAPQPYAQETQPLVFLSGSINSRGPNWRDNLTKSLSHLPITILNPFRKEWDKTWKTQIDFPPFKQQVEWELDAMEASHVLAVYFDSHSDAPITLLELGLFARHEGRKCVVGVADGYHQKGNVQVVCAKFGVDLVENQENFAQAVMRKLEGLGRPGMEKA